MDGDCLSLGLGMRYRGLSGEGVSRVDMARASAATAGIAVHQAWRS